MVEMDPVTEGIIKIDHLGPHPTTSTHAAAIGSVPTALLSSTSRGFPPSQAGGFPGAVSAAALAGLYSHAGIPPHLLPAL